MIRAVPHVRAMASYALADLGAAKGTNPVSLSQNESSYPPSPQALAAASHALQSARLYPDPDWTALRKALADRHSLDPALILCGSGSLDLIARLTCAFADADNACLAPAHAYPFFRTAAAMAGARFDTAPEMDLSVSVSALLNAVRADTRIVLVANPGNPTGTRIGIDDLRALRAGLRPDILLVIDEAYGEFADHLDEPCFEFVSQGNTVVLRTLSKAYGLAGLRVGWGYFPVKIAIEVRKLINPNNISSVSQAAANAAILDQPYMRDVCAATAELRENFTARLRKAEFTVADSLTNFVLIAFANAAAAQSAENTLLANGIILRAQGGAGLPHCLRATIGDAEALDSVTHCLERWAEEHLL